MSSDVAGQERTISNWRAIVGVFGTLEFIKQVNYGFHDNASVYHTCTILIPTAYFLFLFSSSFTQLSQKRECMNCNN